MSKCINPECTNTTNNPHGICAMCKVEIAAAEALKLESGKYESTSKKDVEEEIETMARKKKCTEENCDKLEVKDGLCYRHYKAKHGCAPWGSGKASGAKKTAKDKRATQRVAPTKTAKATERLAHIAVVAVDFRKYPKLLAKIESLAVLDETLPDVVMEGIIHGHLTCLEARA